MSWRSPEKLSTVCTSIYSSPARRLASSDADSDALAATLRTVLDDPEARARVGAAGRQRVIDQWSWRHTALRTVEQYRELLNEVATR